MSYTKEHTPDECDKCLENIGKDNLTKLDFLYLDKNDNIHYDVSPGMKVRYAKDLMKHHGLDKWVALAVADRKTDTGYRQYYVCPTCNEREQRRMAKRKKVKLDDE